MIKITQGYNFDIEVDDPNAKFVLSNGLNKYVLSDPHEVDGALYLSASAEKTAEWVPGKFSYQILNSQGIKEEGDLYVKPNLLISNDTESYWRKVLRQIDERIKGRAIDPADSVSVGDKNIRYLSISELFRLRDFVLGKIAEEKEEQGIEASAPNSQKRIIYTWSLR